MSQYRSGQPSAQQTQKSHRSVPASGAYMISAVVLGICILVAGFNVGGALRTLSKAVAEQEFKSTYNSPDRITVNGTAERKYLTQDEAAAYLNMSVSEISAAIADGKIEDYIITSDGYSISISSLDSFFEDEAYEIKMKKNSAENQ